jgi:cellulose synthase/poly-beta-1,6-N-acetylglucosamine synthase-like glycosyltransferase
MTFNSHEEGCPKVSIVMAVKNEERTIARAIESILNLDYPNCEIILVDGGSTDQTVSIAKRNGITVIQTKDSTPGQGRNMGIKHSSGEIVAFLDGDCYARKDWLKNAVLILKQDGVGGVGGKIVSSSRGSYLSRSILDALSSPLVNASSTLFARYRKLKEVKNIPSCNAIYRREALEKVGFYREDLRFCEDVDLNHRIRAAGYRIFYSPDVAVEHDWKVHSFKSLFRHMLRYGFGRACASRKCRYLFSPFYTVPSVALISLIVLLLFYFTYGGIFMFVTQLLIVAYVLLVLASACLVTYHFKDLRLLVIAPIAYVVTHVGYAIGFIHGLVKRTV